MGREYKTKLDEVQVASFKAICERLEAIVVELERLNQHLEKREFAWAKAKKNGTL